MFAFDEVTLRMALEKAWSIESAAQWSRANPANGQCNVTAAVVYDLFGGEILRTRYPDFWHYYNQVEGKRVDLTDSQFYRTGARVPSPANYDDCLTTREKAMQGIPVSEYNALRKALLLELNL